MFTEDQINAAATAIRDSLANGATPGPEPLKGAARAALEAAHAKGFPQREYGADHKYLGVEMVDEEGRPWTDETDFREQYKDEGDIYTPMVRHVSSWKPLEPEGQR